MAKINSKIDKALRKDVIENGVFLGTIFVLGFTVNTYVYENEVYCEVFQLTENDFVVTDFYQSTWGHIHNNIGHGRFDNNEPYAEALIDFMSLLEDSLYLHNKKYREIAKVKFVELKKYYQESGLLDDINVLLKKSKSKTFRYSKYESEKTVRKSIKENKHNFSVYDFIDYMIEMKCIDDVMDYIDFDITQKEFDNALEDLGYNFKIIKKENPHDSIDGIKYYIYQYQIDDEIYRIWVDETGFVLDACLKY